MLRKSIFEKKIVSAKTQGQDFPFNKVMSFGDVIQGGGGGVGGCSMKWERLNMSGLNCHNCIVQICMCCQSLAVSSCCL